MAGDGSTWTCPDCGGQIAAHRREAHVQWCGADSDDSDASGDAPQATPTDVWSSIDVAKPGEAWQALQKGKALPSRPINVKMLCGAANPITDDSDTAASKVPNGTVRIVCVSDTHGLFPAKVPDGDILIHAGDFSNHGETHELEQFAAWLRSLPHRHKIVVAGNHDVTLDAEWYNSKDANGVPKWKRFHTEPHSTQRCREIVAGTCTFLEDSGCEAAGLRIWGTPWQPEFCDWGFNLPRGSALREKWDRIPTDVDVLVTHTPPLGYGDACRDGSRVGCVDLTQAVASRRIGVHVFGHIHSSYGVTTNGKTVFVNASTCTESYRPTNPPVVVDIIPGVGSLALNPTSE